MRNFDLAVVGAGIGAGSLVYNLLKLGYKDSILVVDRGDAVATGPTAYSAGGFRNLWTTAINQRLCTQAIEILKGFPEEMGSSIGFRQNGYLFTYDQDSWTRVPEAAKLWKSNEVHFELLDPALMENLVPGLHCGVDHIDPEVREYLELKPLAGGVLGRNCGSFDPSQAAAAYFAKARGNAPDSLDTTFEPGYYQEEINPLMQERIPGTERCHLQSGWASLYDTTTPDHNAIVGWHADHPGLLLQVGYSGHDAMESPAVGLCLAELVMHGAYRTIDCGPLRWSRFREGALVEEQIVI